MAASSAFPILLSPLTLHNCSGGAPGDDFRPPRWLSNGLESLDQPRWAMLARNLLSYRAHVEDRPFVHLLDDGLSDNIGLHGPYVALSGQDSAWSLYTNGGHCPAYQQANVAIVPKEVAAEFAAFCTRNPKPCPIIEITPPGDPEPARSAPGADLRTDVPGYRIYRKGELAEQRGDIRDVWRDDLVAFLLGCSFTFEHALVEAGLPPRNVELNTKVPMFVSNITCVPAGRFHGPMVVTMRPVPETRVGLVRELSARYPHAHGAPVYVGDPKAIGIADLSRPDYGEPVPMYANEIPVFWPCGVTPQAVAERARVELMITHEPAQMFVTDLPREGDR